MTTLTFTRAAKDGGAVSPQFTPSGSPAETSLTPTAGSARTREHAEAGAVLVELYEYLATNVWTHRALASVLPVLSGAIAQHRSARSADPFDGARAVLEAIQALRRTAPAIPDP